MPVEPRNPLNDQGEWLDIVDSDDAVIGRATRSVIHRKNHLHRSAHIVLFNSGGKIFVQLRSLLKDNGAGLWDTSAAGHVNSGEEYLDCAVRELAEELGVILSPEDLTFVACLAPESRNGFEFTQVYTACSDQALVLQAEEIDDGRWVSGVELDQWIAEDRAAFTDTFLAIWSKVRVETQ